MRMIHDKTGENVEVVALPPRSDMVVTDANAHTLDVAWFDVGKCKWVAGTLGDFTPAKGDAQTITELSAALQMCRQALMEWCHDECNICRFDAGEKPKEDCGRCGAVALREANRVLGYV